MADIATAFLPNWKHPRFGVQRYHHHVRPARSSWAVTLDRGRSAFEMQRPDVLKVGHHGSAYSSSDAFLAAVHPRYAIISVGRHNHFGHPAPRTIEALLRSGARVYRTDEDAAVSVVSDGGASLALLSTLLDSKRR